jgi:hypothetical protein
MLLSTKATTKKPTKPTRALAAGRGTDSGTTEDRESSVGEGPETEKQGEVCVGTEGCRI